MLQSWGRLMIQDSLLSKCCSPQEQHRARQKELVHACEYEHFFPLNTIVLKVKFCWALGRATGAPQKGNLRLSIRDTI